jgi:hypothetical protein
MGHLFGSRNKAELVDSEEPRYLATLLDYVHLNPARAGIVRLRIDGRLLDHPWSSLPGYIRLRRGPAWLQVKRGLAARDLDDTPAYRWSLIEDLERRAACDEAEHAGLTMVDEQNLQSTLRRGWYYGGQAFRDSLLDQADELLRKRSSKRRTITIAMCASMARRQPCGSSLKGSPGMTSSTAIFQS